jgi:hypothetical protein
MVRIGDSRPKPISGRGMRKRLQRPHSVSRSGTVTARSGSVRAGVREFGGNGLRATACHPASAFNARRALGTIAPPAQSRTPFARDRTLEHCKIVYGKAGKLFRNIALGPAMGPALVGVLRCRALPPR